MSKNRNNKSAKKTNKKPATVADEYAEFSQRRARMLKFAAWIAISALIITTGITFGVASLNL